MKKISLIIISILFMFIGVTNIKASSAKISVSSSTSKIVVGNTFNVTIKVSSSSSIGSWEYTINYDKNKFKLVSGESNVADVAKSGSVKSKTYSYKFKAIATGSGSIGVKSYGVIGWDEKSMSTSAGSTNVKVITQAELEASYSKDNNLKSLSIDGLTLSPKFNKNTTEYTVEANANTTQIKINAKKNDSKASVSGAGKHKVAEGENTFKIVVTAQNGKTKTYKIKVNVVDPNPINIELNGISYTVVKRESSLECPDGYEKTTIKIQEIDIPAFYNETNKYTLIGLKNEDNTSLFIYDEVNNTYTPYFEVELNKLNLFPLEIDKEFDKDYISEEITINNVSFPSLHKENGTNYIIHARNLDTGEDNYYYYDETTNTAIRYFENKEKNKIINSDESNNIFSDKLIQILILESVAMLIITLITLISKIKVTKKLKILAQERLEEKKEKLDNKHKKENNEIEEKKHKKKKAKTKEDK